VERFIEPGRIAMKYIGLLNRTVVYIEGAVTVLLVILAGLGVVDIVLKMLEVTRADGFMTPEGITRTIDTVLVVFIVIELIRIAVSYMQHKNVIGTVLEAGLVAVVRKLVIFESTEGMLEKAIALGVLILAVGITWYLLQRSTICESEPHDVHPQP
jgi:uncharacterized membrane protein (DUF373 family)